MDKQVHLRDAAKLVNDRDTIALGGNVLHRSPLAFIRELIRHNKSKLHIVKTAGAHDVDLLCAVGAVDTVSAGFISYETKYGLATHYRNAVQAGKVKANEHACYTVISALRGAQMNVPFMPVHGLKYGDLLSMNAYFVVVEDPFGGEPVTLVKSIVPDVAVIHVQACDRAGNAWIEGPKFEDVLMSRAAKKVILTTEQIVPENRTKQKREQIDIPGFLVDAIVEVPKGASPGGCYPKYDIDEASLKHFITLTDETAIIDYIASFEKIDYRSKGERAAW